MVSIGISLLLSVAQVEKHAKALEILEIIQTGKMTFNEAAREYSIDKAGRSGLLGWKRKNELDPVCLHACPFQGGSVCSFLFPFSPSLVMPS